MTTYHHPRGVTVGVWVSDQTARLERIIDALGNTPLTLQECERLERALVRGHARNLRRLSEEYGVEEEGL